MNNNNQKDYTYDSVFQIEDADASRRFMANVFLWMFVGLAVSAAFAWAFAHNESLLRLLIDPQTGKSTGLGVAIMFSPIAFVILLSFGFSRLSPYVLTVLFIIFSALMGTSLSYILLAYPPELVTGVFITTSVVFGVMAVAGYFTQQDLTKFGSLMLMLLIGVIVATVVNFIIKSEGIAMIINYVAVAVFVGLTAYDVQTLKRIGAGLDYDDAPAKKMAILGALTLYLDFVNLFVRLLRIFDRRS